MKTSESDSADLNPNPNPNTDDWKKNPSKPKNQIQNLKIQKNLKKKIKEFIPKTYTQIVNWQTKPTSLSLSLYLSKSQEFHIETLEFFNTQEDYITNPQQRSVDKGKSGNKKKYFQQFKDFFL